MNKELQVVAVVSAGWTPSEDDPLAEYTQGKSKALIPIAGKPMIAYVVDALAGSRYIQHIVVVALDPTAKIPEYKVCAVKIEKVEKELQCEL